LETRALLIIWKNYKQMTQYKITGVNKSGKTIQGELEAENKRQVKEKIAQRTNGSALKIKKIEKKRVFLYKVSRNDSPPISGEQEAYSQEELEKALRKLGYKVHKVERKLLDFKGGVPTDDIVSFVRLSADLLKQKLRFEEILNLVAEDTANKRLKGTLKQIEKDLKEGKDGHEVYSKHENIFGRFATYMLSVASTSGNMGEVFESTAKFLERDAEFRKNLRKSLLMPMITLLAVFALVLGYVGYIFPKTAELFLKFDIDLPPMTAGTLSFSHYLQAHWIMLTAAFIVPVIGFIIFIKTPKGKLLFDKYIIKMPVIGGLMHKTSIEIFSRVFYTLYTGSGDNIRVIRIAAEACRNSYMENQITEIAIPMMLKEGKGLVESLEATKVFTTTAISRFRLGSESGSLRSNAQQLANYYEAQTSYRMESTINMINVSISMVIMVAMIAITIVSSETAVIHPNPPGM